MVVTCSLVVVPSIVGTGSYFLGLEVEGVERIFEHFKQDENRCSW